MCASVTVCIPSVRARTRCVCVCVRVAVCLTWPCGPIMGLLVLCGGGCACGDGCEPGGPFKREEGDERCTDGLPVRPAAAEALAQTHPTNTQDTNSLTH